MAGEICSKELNFLVDTGSAITLLSTDIFESFENDIKLEPVQYGVLLADGTSLPVKGQIEIEIDLGPVKTCHNVIVAGIKSQAILGMDFLTKFKCTLDLNKSCLRIGDAKLPLWNEFSAKPNCCRLTVADHVTIPANHEQLIQTKCLKRGNEQRYNLVEGTPLFQSKYGVLVARSLTDITTTNSVLNPTECDIDLWRGTTIALCHPPNLS